MKDESPPKQSGTEDKPVTAGGSQVLTHERLDEIDHQLLALLAERGNLVYATAAESNHSSSSSLEPIKQLDKFVGLHQAWKAHSSSKFPENALDSVFREVLSACASVVAPVRVAYLGPPGTFSHLAGLQSFGASSQLVDCNTIANVFLAVERGEAEYGVVPIENVIEGGVTPTHDCLLRSNLMICSESILVVRLCLVANHDAMSAIERVYSHPQPLAQSRIWLSTHLPHAQTVACTSTAAAAEEARKDPHAAAVTSILSAELYGLNLLAEGIEDIPGNATRFVTIARQDAPPTGNDKTSVVFSTPDERGALMRILSIFDSEGLNLSRIESRPDRTRRWEYVFFTDIEGHRSKSAMERALKRVQSQCQMVQILGSYPQAKLSTV
jgi:chorismate mutase / prephenate dehydratase